MTTWHAALMQASFAALLLEGQQTDESRDDEALLYLEQLAVPALVLDEQDRWRANTRWRRAFGRKTPVWVTETTKLVQRTNVMLHVPHAPPHGTGKGAQVRYSAAVVPIAIDDRRTAIVCRALDTIPEGERTNQLRIAQWIGTVASFDVADRSNDVMAQLAGKHDRECRDVIHESDYERWLEAARHATTQRMSGVVDLRLRRADGDYRWHQVRVLVTPNQRWVALAVDCHGERLSEQANNDLVERVRIARANAAEAHRIKDQVIAVVSHELRAPVMTTLLWERVLREGGADSASRFQALDAIHQSANLQSRIVGDLLDMSRASSGKLFVDFRTIDIGRIVAEAVEAALPAALAKGVTLTHEGSADSGEMAGDAGRLRQTIDNLVSNAIKFTDSGGSVAVSVARKARNVVIKVHDTGRGIAHDALEHIFEPFNQGHATFSRREGGLGLGLAIARQIVELHNGTLTASSDGPGCGTLMTIVLPRQGHPRAPTPPSGAINTLALQGTRMLVVDDDERVRSALALLLERAGAVVDRAESAAAARAELARHLPHIIICDIAMPDETGYELIKSLRAAGNKLPAIALTALASQADSTNAISAGFDLHIAKPVDFQRLVTSVSQVLATRKRQLE